MYSRWLLLLWALRRSTALPVAPWRKHKRLAARDRTAPFNNDCSPPTLDAFFTTIQTYSNVNRSPNVQNNEVLQPMSVQFDATDVGFFCGAGRCSDVYPGDLLQSCKTDVAAGVGYDNTAAELDCACLCDENSFCDAFSYDPDKPDGYACYLHFEGSATCPTGFTFIPGVDAHVGGIDLIRTGLQRCYHKEGIDSPPQPMGLAPTCRTVLAATATTTTPVPTATTTGVVGVASPTPAPTPAPAPGPVTSSSSDATGIGDPHMTNMNGEQFEIYYTGTHSLIRIPGDGAAAGQFLDLSGRVSDFSHLAQVSRCNPYYFDVFDMHGGGLGGAVRSMQVRRDGDGVTFDAVMADGNTSMLNRSLSTHDVFPSPQMVGDTKVSYRTRRRRNLLFLEIQSSPPIVVRLDWFKHNPRKPGLNILVHGLTHKLASTLGGIGGLFGADSHVNVSTSPGFEGCPDAARVAAA